MENIHQSNKHLTYEERQFIEIGLNSSRKFSEIARDIKTYILETKGDPIDDQWLNDERPVMTKDGRQVIVTEIDLKEVPNIIKGKVKMKNELYDYEWEDNGTCKKAIDQYGNPKKADDADKLVKAV